MEVYILENHDMAYQVWKDKKVNASVVFHFDAHMDYSSFNDSYISIGNFIGHAMRENIINTFIWIVPSPSFHRKDILNEILSNLYTLFGSYKETALGYEFNNISKRIFITNVHLLNDLFKIFVDDESFLIDIDVDFFMNPYCNTVYSHFIECLPWAHCYELIDYLSKYLSENSIITISKSILGGYTPIIYECMAYELQDLIKSNEKELNQYKVVYKAIEKMQTGCLDEAIKLFNSILPQNKAYFSSLVGAMYCHIQKKEYLIANKFYRQIIELNHNYEPYLFPVDAIVKYSIHTENKEYLSRAVAYIEEWLNIDEDSQYALINSMKVFITHNEAIKFDIYRYLEKIESENTCFEKDYLLALYYYYNQQYYESINACQQVLHYLSQNNTPIWAGQISSFENRQNAGLVKARMLETISLSYMALGEDVKSKKYAAICKKIGYITSNIIEILNKGY